MPLKDLRIDEEDKHILDNYSLWIDPYGYVICDKTIKGKRKRKRLHVLIMGKRDNLDIDHINGNKLDNRKENLRHVTRSLNLVNKPKRANSRQKYKGIQKLPSGKYRAKGPNGVHWGCFLTPEEAFEQWKLETEKIHGIEIKETDYAFASR